MLRALGHPVAACWVLLAQIWPFLNLASMSQQSEQTRCDAICCVDMLRSFGQDLIGVQEIVKLVLRIHSAATLTML